MIFSAEGNTKLDLFISFTAIFWSETDHCETSCRQHFSGFWRFQYESCRLWGLEGGGYVPSQCRTESFWSRIFLPWHLEDQKTLIIFRDGQWRCWERLFQLGETEGMIQSAADMICYWVNDIVSKCNWRLE